VLKLLRALLDWAMRSLLTLSLQQEHPHPHGAAKGSKRSPHHPREQGKLFFSWCRFRSV